MERTEDLGPEPVHDRGDGEPGAVAGLRRELPAVVVAVALARLVALAAAAHGDEPAGAVEVGAAAGVVEASHVPDLVGGVELGRALQALADRVAEGIHLVLTPGHSGSDDGVGLHESVRRFQACKKHCSYV